MKWITELFHYHGHLLYTTRGKQSTQGQSQSRKLQNVDAWSDHDTERRWVPGKKPRGRNLSRKSQRAHRRRQNKSQSFNKAEIQQQALGQLFHILTFTSVLSAFLFLGTCSAYPRVLSWGIFLTLSGLSWLPGVLFPWFGRFWLHLQHSSLLVMCLHGVNGHLFLLTVLLFHSFLYICLCRLSGPLLSKFQIRLWGFSSAISLTDSINCLSIWYQIVFSGDPIGRRGGGLLLEFLASPSHCIPVQWRQGSFIRVVSVLWGLFFNVGVWPSLFHQHVASGFCLGSTAFYLLCILPVDLPPDSLNGALVAVWEGGGLGRGHGPHAVFLGARLWISWAIQRGPAPSGLTGHIFPSSVLLLLLCMYLVYQCGNLLHQLVTHSVGDVTHSACKVVHRRGNGVQNGGDRWHALLEAPEERHAVAALPSHPLLCLSTFFRAFTSFSAGSSWLMAKASVGNTYYKYHYTSYNYEPC